MKMWMKRFATIMLSLAMLLSGISIDAWAEGSSGCSGAVHDRSQVDEYVSFYTVAFSYGTNAGNYAEEYNNEVCVGTTVDVRFSCQDDIPFYSVYVEGVESNSSQWEAVSYPKGVDYNWSCKFTAMETGNTPPATVKLHAKCGECGEEEVYSYAPNLTVTECGQKYSSSSAQGEPEYEMIDGDSASHLMMQNYSVSCWLCGKTTAKMEETVESHAFDESGKCVCGYQKQNDMAAPEWEETCVDVTPESTVYFFYKVDSAAEYVRLEYEVYTAEGVLTESDEYGTFKVTRRLFGNPLYTEYLYSVFQSNYADYGLSQFTEGKIFRFYLTVCDENGNSLSERSEAFEVRCAISEDTGETITLTASSYGEIVENTTLTFTAVSNSESVKLYIDAFNGETGERYTAVTKNMNRDGTTFTAENQFTAPGRKIVWAETAGGVKSEEIEITVAAAEIQLVAPEYTGATAATVGEPITLSWTEVDGAVGYTAWLRPADDTEDVTNLSDRIVNQSAVYTFAEAGVYCLQIYAVGAEGSGTSEPCNVTITVAEAACEHLNHANDTYLKTEYRSIGSDEVHEKRDVYTHSCTDCGAALSDVYTDWVEEIHEDDGNGYCWKCQTTIGENVGEFCPHANAKAYYDDGALPPRFSNITETHHDVENGYRMYCEDCGQYTGETGYFEVSPEEHIFPNGDVCICGYDRKNCAHTPVDGGALYLRTIFQAKDKKTHLTAADVYQYTCSKCGKVYEETFVRAQEQQETLPHSWKSGVCQELGCGYVCEHAEYTKNVKRTISQYEQSDDKYIDYHIDYHEVTEVPLNRCTNCRYDVKGKASTNYERHFYEGDVCVSCGYSMKGEYYDLLKSLPDGDNPLDNPLIRNLIWTELREVGVSKDMIDQIIDTVHDAPETYRDIYVYSFFLYNKEGADGASYCMVKKIGENEWGVDNTLYMDEIDSVEDYLTTWFHETGHSVEANYTYDDDVYAWDEARDNVYLEYFNKMKDDVAQFIIAQATSSDHPILSMKWNDLTQEEQELIIRSIIGSDEGYPERYDSVNDQWIIAPVVLDNKLQKIRDEIVGHMKAAAYGGTDDTRNAYMVTDCIEGMTNGRASNTVKKVSGFDEIYTFFKYYGGHKNKLPEYWYNDGEPTLKQCAEAWAEYYSAVMTGNIDAINSNLYFFPSTCKYFSQEFAEKLLEHYKALVE